VRVKEIDFLEGKQVKKGYKYLYIHVIPGRLGSLQEQVESMGCTVYSVFRFINALTALIPDKELDSLKRLPEITLVEEVPWKYAVAYKNYRWNMEMIKVPDVHVYNTGEGIKVGVLDSGIDENHYDLSDNYKGGADFTFKINLPHTPGPGHDSCGHGTHCAGIIGASGKHITGVAPEVYLYSIRCLEHYNDPDYGETCVGMGDWVINGIEWAISNSMDVLSMSIGGSGSTAEKEAIKSAYAHGVCLVAAAGNENQDVTYSAPACYDEVIAVAAVDSNKERAWFSNYGNKIDVSAPGVGIYSTVPGDSYKEMDGTSMACPHVSGLAALVKKNNSNLTLDEIKRQISLNAEDLGQDGHDIYYGWGLIDAEQAVPEEPIGGVPELPEIPLPTFEVRGGSKLRQLPSGIMLTKGSFETASILSDGQATGELVIGGSIDKVHDLGEYVDLINRSDGIPEEIEEEEAPEFCYGLFYHVEDESIWIGKRKGNIDKKSGFEFVDAQPILLEREEGASKWENLTNRKKWEEVYQRKLRQNNISIMRLGNKDVAFWCNKKGVAMARFTNSKTLERTNKKTGEEKQTFKGDELAVYQLLNIPDNEQDERLRFYRNNHIPMEWDESTQRLKSVCPLYWMPISIVVKKPEGWVARYNMENNEPWKYIAVVEEIAVKESGNFDDSYFDSGAREGYYNMDYLYCNSEISLYGCKGLNFSDEWKWLTLLSYYPIVTLTSLHSGVSVDIARVFYGYWLRNYSEHEDLDDWILDDFHPADGMIQESISIDMEKGKRYLYTMFGKNLGIDKDDDRTITGTHEKYKDYSGGVVYKIGESKYQGYTYSFYEKMGKFRVYSYEPIKKNEREGLDITDKLRILGIHWSPDSMKIHPELKDQLKNGW